MGNSSIVTFFLLSLHNYWGRREGGGGRFPVWTEIFDADKLKNAVFKFTRRSVDAAYVTTLFSATNFHVGEKCQERQN